MVVFAESSLQVADGDLLIDDQLLMEGCIMVVSSHGRERERPSSLVSLLLLLLLLLLSRFSRVQLCATP